MIPGKHRAPTARRSLRPVWLAGLALSAAAAVLAVTAGMGTPEPVSSVAAAPEGVVPAVVLPAAPAGRPALVEPVVVVPVERVADRSPRRTVAPTTEPPAEPVTEPTAAPVTAQPAPVTPPQPEGTPDRTHHPRPTESVPAPTTPQAPPASCTPGASA